MSADVWSKQLTQPGNVTRYRYTPVNVETLALAHSEESVLIQANLRP